jgi:hypothetical protein
LIFGGAAAVSRLSIVAYGTAGSMSMRIRAVAETFGGGPVSARESGYRAGLSRLVHGRGAGCSGLLWAALAGIGGGRNRSRPFAAFGHALRPPQRRRGRTDAVSCLPPSPRTRSMGTTTASSTSTTRPTRSSRRQRCCAPMARRRGRCDLPLTRSKRPLPIAEYLWLDYCGHPVGEAHR